MHVLQRNQCLQPCHLGVVSANIWNLELHFSPIESCKMRNNAHIYLLKLVFAQVSPAPPTLVNAVIWNLEFGAILNLQKHIYAMQTSLQTID